MKYNIYTLLAIVIFALLWALPAMAEDSTPNPTPSPETTEIAPAVGDVTVTVEAPQPTAFPIFNLSEILASLVAYLLYLGTGAGAAQAAIAKIDVPILQPIKKQFNLDDKGYQVEMDVARFLAAIITLFSLGGLATVKGTLAPILAVIAVPDLVVVIGSILLLVAGQDLIFGLINQLYATQAAVDVLQGKVDAQNAVKVQVVTDEPINRGRY